MSFRDAVKVKDDTIALFTLKHVFLLKQGIIID